MRYSSAEAVRHQTETVRTKVCVRILGGGGGTAKRQCQNQSDQEEDTCKPNTYWRFVRMYE